MSVLLRNHGTTATNARSAVQTELRQLGYDSYVVWKGNEATVSAGGGWLLDARGHITDVSVIIDKCGGGFGSIVLGKCREVLERLFPATTR